MATKKKKKQMTTVALKVQMHCDGCARKMKSVLTSVKGAKSVDVDMKQQKVTVTWYVDAKKVLGSGSIYQEEGRAMALRTLPPWWLTLMFPRLKTRRHPKIT